MNRVFLSYRRSDSQSITERMYDHLSSKFGKENVFKDVTSIPFGHDFRTFINKAVSDCDVLVAIIGDDWLIANDESGKRRLFDVDDYVRVEIETAIDQGVTIIPVLVGGASMPAADDLPESIQQLAYLNCAAVRNDPDFLGDIDRLSDQVGPILDNPDSNRPFSTPSQTRDNSRLSRFQSVAISIALIVAATFAGLAIKNQLAPTMPLPPSNINTTGEKAVNVRYKIDGGPVVILGEEPRRQFAERGHYWLKINILITNDFDDAVHIDAGKFRFLLSAGGSPLRENEFEPSRIALDIQRTSVTLLETGFLEKGKTMNGTLLFQIRRELWEPDSQFQLEYDGQLPCVVVIEAS